MDPADITYLTGTYEEREQGHLDYVPHFKPREASWAYLPYIEEVPYGVTRSGDWDESRNEFDQLYIVRGARERFLDEKSWEQTSYYTALCEAFRERGLSAEAATARAIDRCEKLERIYQRITTHGYRSQAKLNGHPLHEVTITVGRNGELLYNCEGRHRLTVAKLHDIDAIPVQVLVTHEGYDGEVGYQDRDALRDRGESK
ncbi:hypothetical protein [Halovivax gelatinilyticus]|uniref:hypothetical protein n=1 Tax=Halovivax gelatinilyticus TaxID=2961597 RepID=UPI0020CA92BA|nr:hypothetical protein [Halovivax gelatinilyticus]